MEHLLDKYGLSLYIKDIIVLEQDDDSKKHLLPFFADGYPGIVFQQTKYGLFHHPKNKQLSELFLYGQTIHPMELSVEGAYRMIVFRLYPFAAAALFHVNPKTLNDDCYDLVSGITGTTELLGQLAQTETAAEQAELIAGYLSRLTLTAMNHHTEKIRTGIHMILASEGRITVKALREQLHMTERTLQRQFTEYIGISPKQFINVIRFSLSLNHLSGEAYARLTEIVYEYGYADQSHFIRDFKRFTGKKPSDFKVSG